MTPFPHFIDLQASASRALQMMTEQAIHHLPVMDGETLVGIVRARDLRRAEALVGDRRSDLKVADVGSAEVYVVDLWEPLDRVLSEMADRRLDVALVVKADKLVGIFTVTDACRAFAEDLRRRFPVAGGEDDAA